MPVRERPPAPDRPLRLGSPGSALTATGALRLGLAVTTIGRPTLRALLTSASRSRRPPCCVAIANQSGAPLSIPTAGFAFPVQVVTSSGGASRGRNDAFRMLNGCCDVVGFPNDDSLYGPDLLHAVADAFAQQPAPAAVACRLEEPGGPRFTLPGAGTALDRRTVWSAIEPATFVASSAFRAVVGFREDLGTGSPSAWGSGEGTDLLLRVMAAGGRVVSRPDLQVHGFGERRELNDVELVRKHRTYARGTGHVYRTHGYPLRARMRTVVGPMVKANRHDERLGLSLRLAVARSVGRLEGLAGRFLERGPSMGRRLDASGGRPGAGSES